MNGSTLAKHSSRAPISLPILVTPGLTDACKRVKKDYGHDEQKGYSMKGLVRIGWLALIVFSLSSGTAHAANPNKDVTNPEACQSCHRGDSAHPMLGLHGGDRYGPTNQAASCADCHGVGESGSLHEAEQTDIVRFTHMSETNNLSTPLAQQNQACLSCHLGTELRTAHWTHDPHANTLTCASCHQLHPSNDPMRGLAKQTQTKQCVDCHSTLPNDIDIFNYSSSGGSP